MAEKSSAEQSRSIDTEHHHNEYLIGYSSSNGKRKLPMWLDHFNAADFKTLFKCSVAAWVMCLLILIGPSLRIIGQATFFGVVVIYIAPPAGVVFMGLMAGITLVTGLCLGWAWGAITLQAALATRPAADLQRQYQQLQEAASSNTTNTLQASGQAAFEQQAIFDGFMLDARVTVTTFSMIGLFVYLIARLRVAAPKTALLSTFAVVVSDLWLTIGPLIPQFIGTLPRTLIIPATIGMGLSLACNVLLFPKSTSHTVLDDTLRLLTPMSGFVQACGLHFQGPSVEMELRKLKITKARLVGLYAGIEQKLKFLALDLSISRWSAGDVKSLQEPLRQTMISFTALLQVQINRLEFQMKDRKLFEMAERIQSKEARDVSGSYHLARAFDLRKEFGPSDVAESRTAALRRLGVASEDLVEVSRLALSSASDIVRDVNAKTWYSKLATKDLHALDDTHMNTLKMLRRHSEQLPAKVVLTMFDNQKFDAASHENGRPRSMQFYGLVYALILEERLLSFASAVGNLLERLTSLEKDRNKARIWLPGSIRDVVSWGLDDTPTDFDLKPQVTKVETTTVNGQYDIKKKTLWAKREKKSQAQAPYLGASRGGRQRSKLAKFILAGANWFGNTEGLYALRVLVVTMGLGALAVNRQTASLFYREKGLWALIMAQTGLLPFTGDLIWSVGLKTVGTLLGGITGLVCWYTGVGAGSGLSTANSIGLAAVLLPVIVATMWARLFLSPAYLQGVIVFTTTAMLVVAYSVVDARIPSYGSVGIAYEVFWRRMLLVMVGFSVAAFVTLFPRPPSANRHYRQILSNAIQTTKDQYALFASCTDPVKQPGHLRDLLEDTALSQSKILTEIEPQIPLTKFELSSSPFDARTLGIVARLCMRLNQDATQLALYASKAPASFRQRFFQSTGAATEKAVANIMAVLTIAQFALQNGQSVPAIMPVPLMERTLRDMRLKFNEREIDFENVQPSLLEDQEVRRYFTAVAAFVQFLGAVDELVLTVKDAVGETSYVDLEA